MANFERFDETFDTSDGGALYTSEPADGIYDVLGALWLDGGADGLHYFAFRGRYERGADYDGLVVGDRYAAADAFSRSTDVDVAEELGWFSTIDEAVAAVESRAAYGAAL